LKASVEYQAVCWKAVSGWKQACAAPELEGNTSELQPTQRASPSDAATLLDVNCLAKLRSILLAELLQTEPST
jgi:hypothetical protein